MMKKVKYVVCLVPQYNLVVEMKKVKYGSDECQNAT